MSIWGSIFGVLLCVGPPPAQSEEESSDSPARSSVVLMAPDLPGQSLDERLLGAVEAHVGEAPLDLKIVRYAGPDLQLAKLPDRSAHAAGEFAATAVIWLDLRSQERFTIYLYDPRSERLLRRTVSREAQSETAAIETLANIAGSIVAESIHGPVAGMTDVELEDPADHEQADVGPDAAEPIPPTAGHPYNRLWLGAGYTGSTFADRVPWTHGVSFAFAVTPTQLGRHGLLMLQARYDLTLPVTTVAQAVEVQLRRHPVRVAAGYRHRFEASRVDVETLLWGGIDPIVRTGRDRDETDDTTAPPGQSIRVFSSVGASLGGGFAPLPWLRLFVAVGAEIVTSRADYVLLAPVRTVVVSPHPARFTVDAGVQFGFVRRPARSSRKNARSRPPPKKD